MAWKVRRDSFMMYVTKKKKKIFRKMVWKGKQRRRMDPNLVRVTDSSQSLVIIVLTVVVVVTEW